MNHRCENVDPQRDGMDEESERASQKEAAEQEGPDAHAAHAHPRRCGPKPRGLAAGPFTED